MNQIPPDDAAPPVDVSPHQDASMEWWTVQGHYEAPHSGRRYFLVSLLRQRVLLEPGNWVDGFCQLLSISDPSTGQYEASCRVDPAMVSGVLRSQKDLREDHLDPGVVEAYVREIDLFGLPRPIRLEREKAALHCHPFQIGWSDFSLRQEGKTFELSFVDPSTGQDCRFALHLVRPPVSMEGRRAPKDDPIDYVAYPSLDLQGTAGEEKVSGKGWLDHQWGKYEWCVNRSSKTKALGWEWFGIELEDGSEWILITWRDMNSRRVIGRDAILCDGRTNTPLGQGFSARPLRYWESDETHIRYPVAWTIKIPGQQTELTFEPFIDGQEILTLGVFRALWDGAGRISGKVDGRLVQGEGRLRLYGYGYIFDFPAFLRPFIDRVDQLIEEFLPKTIDELQLEKYVGLPFWENEAAAHTRMLSEPIWDLILREGKHWRPIFCLLLLEALGVSSKPYESIAAIIPELCHTGSLIIDDIEDGSLLRRGDRCIHLRYGLDVAINAANSLYFLPYLLLLNHPHLDEQQRGELYRIMIRQHVRAHFGQGLDIFWSKNLTPENLTRWMQDSLGSKILQMYAYKTAAPIEGMAENACVIARSAMVTRKTCLSFARCLGVAFQIMDDVRDFDDSRNGSKGCGQDLSSGKMSYVMLRALEALRPSKRERLQEILCSKTLRTDPFVVQEGIDLVRESEALSDCQGEARSMVEEEWVRFSANVPSSDPKILLRTLWSHLLGFHSPDGDRARDAGWGCGADSGEIP